MPLEIYMEGNIVFRQGDRTVYADRMFYDVRRQIGELSSVVGSRAGSTFLAEAYTGWPTG